MLVVSVSNFVPDRIVTLKAVKSILLNEKIWYKQSKSLQEFVLVASY